ncbi:MAG: hypothetical protein J6U92_02080 [Clostridia bacterium]|nr:hypothetical protein [Clostridia bacterium]
MKAYYLICTGIGFLLGLIMFLLSGISGCVMKNNVRREINGYTDWVSVRYYMGDTEDSVLKYKLQANNEFFELSQSEIPRKENFVFAGFWDSRDFQNGIQYVDNMGEGLIIITEDIVLYPVFVPIGD